MCCWPSNSTSCIVRKPSTGRETHVWVLQAAPPVTARCPPRGALRPTTTHRSLLGSDHVPEVTVWVSGTQLRGLKAGAAQRRPCPHGADIMSAPLQGERGEEPRRPGQALPAPARLALGPVMLSCARQGVEKQPCLCLGETSSTRHAATPRHVSRHCQRPQMRTTDLGPPTGPL